MANRVKHFEELLTALPHGRPRGARLNKDDFLAATRQVRLAAVRSWMRQGMFTTALKRIEIYTAYFPDDARGYLLKGEIFRRRIATPAERQRRIKDRSDYGKALTLYEDALALDPASPAAWLGKGQVLLKIGNPDEAAAAFLRYATLAPAAPDLAHYEGEDRGL